MESGNSISMLENVTSSIFHCPCPQVNAWELMRAACVEYIYLNKILAGGEEYEPGGLPGQLHEGGGGEGTGHRDAWPLWEGDDWARFSRSWTVQVSMLSAKRGEEIHKSLGLLTLNHKCPICMMTMNEPIRNLPISWWTMNCILENLVCPREK